MRTLFIMLLLIGCGRADVTDAGAGCADSCAVVGATRCLADGLSTCDGQCWNASGTCTILVVEPEAEDAGAIDGGVVDGGTRCSALLSGDVPNRPCTADLTNIAVCPGGPSGVGYSCGADGCWQPFADGVCTGPGPNDGGVQCPNDPCVTDGEKRCQNRVLSTCHNTCWSPTNLCD